MDDSAKHEMRSPTHLHILPVNSSRAVRDTAGYRDNGNPGELGLIHTVQQCSHLSLIKEETKKNSIFLVLIES